LSTKSGTNYLLITSTEKGKVSGKNKKSWHTEDWKERRDKIIKNECEICGGSDTLTLQHLSHPKKYKEYEREVTRKYNTLFKESNSSVEQQEFIDHVKKNFDYVPAPLCPKCNSRYVMTPFSQGVFKLRF